MGVWPLFIVLFGDGRFEVFQDLGVHIGVRQAEHRRVQNVAFADDALSLFIHCVILRVVLEVFIRRQQNAQKPVAHERIILAGIAAAVERDFLGPLLILRVILWCHRHPSRIEADTAQGKVRLRQHIKMGYDHGLLFGDHLAPGAGEIPAAPEELEECIRSVNRSFIDIRLIAGDEDVLPFRLQYVAFFFEDIVADGGVEPGRDLQAALGRGLGVAHIDIYFGVALGAFVDNLQGSPGHFLDVLLDGFRGLLRFRLPCRYLDHRLALTVLDDR